MWRLASQLVGSQVRSLADVIITEVREYVPSVHRPATRLERQVLWGNTAGGRGDLPFLEDFFLADSHPVLLDADCRCKGGQVAEM